MLRKEEINLFGLDRLGIYNPRTEFSSVGLIGNGCFCEIITFVNTNSSQPVQA
jgi:hypothetical protein